MPKGKLSYTPPRFVQATVIVVAAVLIPVCLLDGPSGWKLRWSIGAYLVVGAYALVVAGFALHACGIAGRDVTTKEQDQKIGQAIDRLQRRYWWVVMSALVLYLAYIHFRHYR